MDRRTALDAGEDVVKVVGVAETAVSGLGCHEGFFDSKSSLLKASSVADHYEAIARAYILMWPCLAFGGYKPSETETQLDLQRAVALAE